MNNPALDAAIRGMSQQEIDRFWSYVYICTDSECWPWLGGTRNGYGAFSLGTRAERKTVKANRVAAFLIHGIPEDPKAEALHTCDNPPCCNGFHLFWGTQSLNMWDAAAKGRHSAQVHPETRQGERHARAKLVEADIVVIRSSSLTQYELSLVYGVALSTIGHIRTNRTWRHLL